MTYKQYECHKLDSQTQVFFYEQEFYVLSNFSSFAVMYEGLMHTTAEHAYHVQKFTDTRREEVLKVRSDILYATSAHDAFKFGQNTTLRRKDWEDVKETIMLRILWAKVHQHEYVRVKLLETGDRELIEDSWRDSFWGWGPDQKGRNLLGNLWMTIRHALNNNVDLFPNEPGLKTGRTRP